MSLRFAILGALALEPASGYDLVRRFDKTLNFVWWASQGAVYTELGRLQDEGLVAPHEAGARGRQSYAVTGAGTAALRDWLRAPPSRRPRDELVLRVFSLWLLEPDDAAAYLDELASGHRSRLAEYESRAGRDPDPADRRAVMDRIALNAGLANERAMLVWAEESAATLRSGQR